MSFSTARNWAVFIRDNHTGPAGVPRLGLGTLIVIQSELSPSNTSTRLPLFAVVWDIIFFSHGCLESCPKIKKWSKILFEIFIFGQPSVSGVLQRQQYWKLQRHPSKRNKSKSVFEQKLFLSMCFCYHCWEVISLWPNLYIFWFQCVLSSFTDNGPVINFLQGQKRWIVTSLIVCPDTNEPVGEGNPIIAGSVIATMWLRTMMMMMVMINMLWWW